MKPDFTKSDGLVPVIIQDDCSQQVLMLGYMNEAAFTKTQLEGHVTFFSRTRNKLWTKGETSGNYLLVSEMHADCDNDTILIKAKPLGPTCHTGTTSCFNTIATSRFLYQLETIIAHKLLGGDQPSYTRDLFKKGIHKIAQKVGEEAVEVVIEAMANNDTLLKNEVADLLYHLLILLKAKNLKLEDIEAVLEQRHIQIENADDRLPTSSTAPAQ